jgi:hypothetical protein
LYISKLYGVSKHDGPLFKPALKGLLKNLTALNITLKANTIINLDPAFDSKGNQNICTVNGCIPNIKVNPRNSGKQNIAPNPKVYKQRYVNERAFAWEDCYRRLVIRYEVKPQNHLGFCLMAAALTLLRLIRN